MQHDICIAFGKHLKKLRLNTGKSLEKFAYENELSKSTLSRIENGEGNPSLTTLYKIAASLEISLDKLLRFK